MRAVVHTLNGQWQLSGVEALKEQGTNLTHGEDGFQTACQVCLVIAIAFLGDGKRDHLQRGILENFHEAVPVFQLWISLQSLSHTGDDLLLDGTCRLE